MNQYKNKIIWITGASSGIGEALVYELSNRGASIVLSSRNAEKLEVVRKKSSNPESHTVIPLDLEHNSEFQNQVNVVLEKYSQIDMLINCGAVSQKAISYETNAEVDRKIMEVNYWGTVNLSRLVLNHMLENKRGMIVVFSSVLGKIGISGRSSYSASKHALHGYFDSLRCDLRKQGYKDIKIKMVCPGYIKTRISYNYLDENGSTLNFMDGDHEKAMSPEASAKIIARKLQGSSMEFLIGGREVLAVYLKRFLQGFFLKNSYKY